MIKKNVRIALHVLLLCTLIPTFPILATPQAASSDCFIAAAMASDANDYLNIYLRTSRARAAWDEYLKTSPREPKLAFDGGKFATMDGSPLPEHINKWTKDLEEIMSDPDSWVNWNIAFAERIRAVSETGSKDIYASMMQVLRDEAVARGFGSTIYFFKNGPENWRSMLQKGHIFIDKIAGRYGHTEPIHALQLLYAQRMLEFRGYPKGSMSMIMKEFLGNTRLIDKLKLIDTQGRIEGFKYSSPWFNLFDADSKLNGNPSRPEWFGQIWHKIVKDIPYDEIRKREKLSDKLDPVGKDDPVDVSP